MSDPSAFRLRVDGNPVSKGSMKAFVPKGWKRAVVTAANPNTKQWEKTIKTSALEHSPVVSSGEWRVVINFAMKRPQRLPKGRKHHTTKPDLDKLVRCVLDALTGVLWVDDSQVITIRAFKFYAAEEEVPHVDIIAWGAE
jgi:crossover junction endodeoxyribonuclease RusA